MIHISEQAAKQIASLKSQQSLEDSAFLRVAVKAGGCSGLSYSMDFDTEERDGDKAFEQNGVKIVCDPKSYLHLIGLTLDFDGGLNGNGFQFSNPNASKTCGCGASFSV